MIKVVTLFLVVVVVLAMFGRLRLPGQGRLQSRLQTARCPDCGRFRLGRKPCACKRGRG